MPRKPTTSVPFNPVLCSTLGAPKKHWINNQIMPNVSFEPLTTPFEATDEHSQARKRTPAQTNSL